MICHVRFLIEVLIMPMEPHKLPSAYYFDTRMFGKATTVEAGFQESVEMCPAVSKGYPMPWWCTLLAYFIVISNAVFNRCVRLLASNFVGVVAGWGQTVFPLWVALTHSPGMSHFISPIAEQSFAQLWLQQTWFAFDFWFSKSWEWGKKSRLTTSSIFCPWSF